jgi:hypothetical protein
MEATIMRAHPDTVAQMAAGVSPGKTVASTDLPYWMLCEKNDQHEVFGVLLLLCALSLSLFLAFPTTYSHTMLNSQLKERGPM